MPRILLSLLLAALSLVALGAIRASQAGTRDAGWYRHALYRRAPGGGGLPYRLFVPPHVDAHEKLSLIVFLHGSGQNGVNNEDQIASGANGALQLLDEARRNHIRLLFAAPQSPQDYWVSAQVMAVIAGIEREWPVDHRRIVLTGLSTGATGVWDMAKAWPDCFAALVPMSGMTELVGLASIADVPEWVFHAADDNDTDVETGYGGAMVGSRNVVRALRAAGGHPRYTEYAHGPKDPSPHVIWPRAYATPGLLEWMLRQHLPARRAQTR
ncbi:MAG: PHB depolymerase family esterase [Rhodanobacteraceae bacterium]